jgi:hypothetical protein
MTRQPCAIDSIWRPFENVATLRGATRGKLGLWGIVWGVSIIFGGAACSPMTNRQIEKPRVPQRLGAFYASLKPTYKNGRLTPVRRRRQSGALRP